ncbi:uncharacterized protein N0V89_005936 [Didymosphaeria variabile]|uniref:Uncharacterized protein n=1 Tax=Didymosphaeria variabile TaxID=1932322 RepID=A0A9W9CBP0_9PLEO|nr:uncharacterized protein N0V89_005936 [Didymosphaeria variabile]KAJ4354202.1 hypothetical protein N0V89_005936 [Didymosphaeria variabile]
MELDRDEASSDMFTSPPDLHRPLASSNKQDTTNAIPTRQPLSEKPINRAAVNRTPNVANPNYKHHKHGASPQATPGRKSVQAAYTARRPSLPRHEVPAPREIYKAAKAPTQASINTVDGKIADGPVLVSQELEDWEVGIEEITSDSDLDSEVWSDAEVTALSPDAAFITSSKTPHATPEHYSTLPVSDIKDSFEEAMLKTLQLKDFDAVMAYMMGEAALDDGTHDAKLIRQLHEGIDESNKKLGLPSLGDIYGTKSEDGRVEVGILAKAMRKSPTTLTGAEKQHKAEQRGTKRPDRHAKQAIKIPVQTEMLLKKPTNEGKAFRKPYGEVKSRYLDQSRKHQASVPKDNKEGDDSKVLAWWGNLDG